MARPVKNYCDYFPHDRDMRNHKKIKAIRSKFGIVGYGIWVMILEHLTGSDGNVFEYTDLEFELMAGDFMVSATEIRDVLDYCIKLELLFNENGWVKSESLDSRLVYVYEKRKVSKLNSAKQSRTNGKFAVNNTENNGVSVTEMPQIKEKGIEGKENKLNDPSLSAIHELEMKIVSPSSHPNWREDCAKFWKNDSFKVDFCKTHKIPLGNLEKLMTEFVLDQNLKGGYKDAAGLKIHFIRSYNKYHKGQSYGPTRATQTFTDLPSEEDYENMITWPDKS